MGESAKNRYDGRSLRGHLFQECEAMAKYALSSGLKVEKEVIQTLDALKSEEIDLRADVAALTEIHNQLALTIAPAKPSTILTLQTEEKKGGIFGFLGPVGMIRRMMFAAILFLVLFIAIPTSPLVDVGGGDMLKDNGWDLLLNLLFFISAAGLGASFYGLYQANEYVSKGTFDPRYEASYWMRLVLGMIAGLILAEIAIANGLSSVVQSDPTNATTNASDLVGVLNPGDLAGPIFALLGGFSASVVYAILNRLVYSLESLVRGNPRELIALQEQEARARFAEELAQSRLKTASQLMGLQKMLTPDAKPEEIHEAVSRIIDDEGLLPLSSYEDYAKKREDAALAKNGAAKDNL